MTIWPRHETCCEYPKHFLFRKQIFELKRNNQEPQHNRLHFGNTILSSRRKEESQLSTSLGGVTPEPIIKIARWHEITKSKQTYWLSMLLFWLGWYLNSYRRRLRLTTHPSGKYQAWNRNGGDKKFFRVFNLFGILEYSQKRGGGVCLGNKKPCVHPRHHTEGFQGSR